MNPRAGLALVAACLLTGGCVAAAVPVVAGGLIARDRLGRSDEGRQRVGRPERGEAPAFELKTPEARAALAGIEGAGMSAVATDPPSPQAVTPTALTALPPPDGSIAASEEAARSLQAYQALWAYLSAQAGRRARGEAVRSVVLAPAATLAAPRYVECGDKPLAMVIDLDEDPAKSADPDARWRRWKGDGSDLIAPVPGAVEGVEAARREGVGVLFTTARSPQNAPGVVATLDRLGFGRVEPGKTLFLRGDASADRLRQSIAADHCVIALVGDMLDDFSGLLPAAGESQLQSMAVTDTMVAPLWGSGWFLLPNPVRSTAPVSTASNGETRHGLDPR